MSSIRSRVSPRSGLQGVLGLGCYQTAWAWLHKLRRAMVLPGRELLCGVVEVDETCVGARHTSVGGRSLGHKTIVVVAVDGDQAPGGCGCVGIRTPSATRWPTTCSTMLPVAARSGRTPGPATNEIGRYRFEHVVINMSSTGDPAHLAL